MSTYFYDASFLRYASKSSAYAAKVITAQLAPLMKVGSVLDVGCASGTWLNEWQQRGVLDIQGLDGDYVDQSKLEIPDTKFIACNLERGFDLNRTFDLVQCLEVAEHLAPASSEKLIACISQHASKFVLFSAAPPGQGGEFHINEQPYEYWRHLFRKHGFIAMDAIRPKIRNEKEISYWYRYNVFLYVKSDLVNELDGELKKSLIPDDRPLADISPVPFKLRKHVIRMLPLKTQQKIASFKARVMPSGRI